MAFEGAHQVFAGVRAHHPNMNLWPLVRAPPGGRNPQQIFEEVAEEAECAARVCALHDIVRRAPKPDSPAS